MAILNIRRVERSDLENCIALEKCCYPPLETATRELLEKRIEIYPDGFYVAEIENKIVGMVNCGATHQEDITEEAFKQLIGHVRNGKNGVVFSLAVYPDHRNKGIASLLIKEIVRVSKSKQKENILLL
ncbi:MAG: GNAT family N-acetyltransferase, partial [Desulfobulbaceae bacterium]|nr:GNAT family N-acetyltransferase [Desulfobulbaceae bacterium]